MKSLEEYISAFKSLGCARVKGYTAPHKAVMLLTVMESIAHGDISDAIVPHSNQMVEEFQQMWERYIGKHPVFRPVFEMPYYHLGSEGFWKLIKSEQYQPKSSYSINQLRICYDGAQLDQDLFSYMQDAKARIVLRDVLIEKYLKGFSSMSTTSRFVPKFKSFFDRLLENHGYETCPLPLWKLKITDDEFESLRERLAEETTRRGRRPFLGIPRECCLFFAEYWRRYYIRGSHSIQMVFDAIDATPTVAGFDFNDLLYQAAKNGAELLGIRDSGHNRMLDTLLYQGGLPIQKIYTPETNSTWDRFTKGLVFRNVDFDALELGVIAKEDKGLREFCTQLCDAVDSQQYLKMPFYCSNDNDPLYRFFLEKFNRVKREHKMRQPFSIEWQFTLDPITHQMKVRYEVTASQNLPEVFLEQQGLKGCPFFTVLVECDSITVDSFDFKEGYSRKEVKSNNTYRDDELITVVIKEQNKAILSDFLDLEVPHLLYRNDNGKFVPGNRIGSRESIILISEGWTAVNESDYKIEEYTWNETKYRGILLPFDFAGDVILSKGEETLTISSNTVFYWTEIASPGLSIPFVKEKVYDANNIRLLLCSESEDTVKRVKANVKYRSKWSDQWVETPPVGEIFAKAVHPYGEFVTPVEFVNVGTSPSVVVTAENDDTCIIKVDWPYGNVSTIYGQKLGDGVSWKISKNDCDNIRRIPFTFTPSNSDYRNAFTLHVKAPFKFFAIEDFKGNEVCDDSWIPYSEIDKYTYHVGEMDIRSLVIGKDRYKLTWIDDALYMYKADDDNAAKHQIPFEGSLSTLLGSREAVAIMLDRTAENMLKASLSVVVDCGKGRKLRFEIKESPYRIRQNGQTLTLNCGPQQLNVDYTGALMLYKLTDPSREPYKLSYDSEQGYVLPEEVSSWGKIIATGRRRGIICPALVEYTRSEDEEDKKTRDQIIDDITDELNKAELGDDTWKRIIGWFNITQSQDLPASSFLDLVSVGRSSELLLRLAFQLYCAVFTDDDRDLLLNKLNYLSKDLAFQWFWILPTLQDSLFDKLSFKYEDFRKDFFMSQYYLWAAQQENAAKLIQAANNNTDDYFGYAVNMANGLLSTFSAWMFKLCDRSLRETYKEIENPLINEMTASILNKKKRNQFERYTNESYIEYNQNDIEDVYTFFKQFDDGISRADNHQWLMRRVNAMCKHLNGDADLFKLVADYKDANIADKIRRSLIFCFKTNRNRFLYELNNLLYRQ